MKIKRKINLSFILAFIILVSLIGVFVGIYTVNLIKKDIYSYLHSSNRARAEHIRTFLQEKKNTSTILAAASVYRDLLKEPINSSNYLAIKNKVDKRFIRTLEGDKEIIETFILDKTGKVIVSSDKAQEGKDKSKDVYFLNAKNETYIKDVYFSETLKKFSFALSSPIKEDDGTFLGISVLRYNPSDFYSVVSNENGLGATEENFLVNKDKLFISPSLFLGSDVILKQKVDTENVNNCFSKEEIDYVNKNGYTGFLKTFGNQIVESKDYRNIDVIGTHAYIPEIGWCLVTKVDKSDAYSFKNTLIIIFLIIFLIAGSIFLIISYLISRKIINPIKFLELGIDNIKQGNFDYRIKVNSKDEIGAFANSFNDMAFMVRDSNENIKKKVEEQTKSLYLKTKELNDQKSAILNILEDVEKEKIKSEELSFIVRDASEPIVTQGLDGTVLNWNNGAEKLYGYTANEIIGNSIKMIIPEDKYKEIENIRNSILGGKEVEHFQTIRKKKDGTLVDVSLSVSPVKDQAGKIIGISVITLDITKEKQIDKTKTEFVSLASHQLRTPLSAINWYTEMLLAGDAGKLNEEQEKYLKEVYVGNQRMVTLVNALLNVSRLDLGTFAINPKPINVIEMTKSVLTELKGVILEKKLKINETYEDNLPPFMADQNLLRIVFQNLLSNSVKYTPENGEVSVSISTVLKDKNFGEKIMKVDSLNITVTDSGMGIPENQKDKMFNKLFRADNARETETEGTGLGLYLVKSIVDKSEGEIWFNSTENKGTTFYIAFPLSGMKKKEGSKSLE
jgi:PAS domain S-box-containing protein